MDEIIKPYRKKLARLVRAIEAENNLEYEDVILLLYFLNSEEKAQEFRDWVQSKMKDGRLDAIPEEIMAAAQRISETNDHEL